MPLIGRGVGGLWLPPEAAIAITVVSVSRPTSSRSTWTFSHDVTGVSVFDTNLRVSSNGGATWRTVNSLFAQDASNILTFTMVGTYGSPFIWELNGVPVCALPVSGSIIVPQNGSGV